MFPYIVLLVFAMYLMVGLYTWWVQKKALALFLGYFPKVYEKYFEDKTYNEKRIAGVSLLWDKEIYGAIKSNNELLKLFILSRKLMVIFIVFLFLFPAVIFVALLIGKHIGIAIVSNG